jgi:hypothetical protein
MIHNFMISFGHTHPPGSLPLAIHGSQHGQVWIYFDALLSSLMISPSAW